MLRLSSPFENRKSLTVRIWAAAFLASLPCSRQLCRVLASAIRLWMCLLLPVTHKAVQPGCLQAILSAMADNITTKPQANSNL